MIDCILYNILIFTITVGLSGGYSRTAYWLNKPKESLFFSCSGTEDSLLNCTERVGLTVSTYCYGVVTLKCIPELPGNSTIPCMWLELGSN